MASFEEMPQEESTSRVFVVHGRNVRAKEALVAFLKSLRLQPLVWQDVVRATGKPNPHISDVLDKGFSIATAVIVLYTGDEHAELRSELRQSTDLAESVSAQPRPNVIYEAGMAVAKFPDRTILVKLGSVRISSDLWGRHYVDLENPDGRAQLVDALTNSRCAVDTSGDWQQAGDFSGCLYPGHRNTYNEIANLTTELASRDIGPRGKSLLSWLEDAVAGAPETREWSPKGLMSALQRAGLRSGEGQDDAYWWLCVDGVFKFNQIGEWWDPDVEVPNWRDSMDYTEVAERGRVLLRGLRFSLPRVQPRANR